MIEKQVRKVPCQVYSRVVGYLRPIEDWNIAKQKEFKDRVNYTFQEETLENREG